MHVSEVNRNNCTIASSHVYVMYVTGVCMLSGSWTKTSNSSFHLMGLSYARNVFSIEFLIKQEFLFKKISDSISANNVFL